MSRSAPVIADLDIRSAFCVYDTISGHYIYSCLDPAGPGDIPPDIACLPVVRTRSVGSSVSVVLYIDVEVRP